VYVDIVGIISSVKFQVLFAHFNRLMAEFISGCAHPGNDIDSVFLSKNGGRLQNTATA